ncbi:MAG TPA: hypothetical protein VL574_17220 [Stellaceae bacterium]|nr:hypothetical protein [Stellaceae bacterium]
MNSDIPGVSAGPRRKGRSGVDRSKKGRDPGPNPTDRGHLLDGYHCGFRRERSGIMHHPAVHIMDEAMRPGGKQFPYCPGHAIFH